MDYTSSAMTTVSIVIRALNEAAHLPALFDGIARQVRPPEELILVDSGSTDETVSIGRRAGARIVTIAPSEFTFGRALNVGCDAASSEVLVFVSAHTYPADEHWLERLVAPIEAHDEVALVYGRQTGDQRTAFSENEIMRQWFPVESEPNQNHPFCNNANCAVRASVRAEHPYDETLTGLEDLEWAFRVQQGGYRVFYEAGAVIVHVHEECFEQTVNRYRREAIAHKRIFGQHRMYGLEAIGLFLANTARDYVRRTSAKAAIGKPLGNSQISLRAVLGLVAGVPPGGRAVPGAQASLLLPAWFHVARNGKTVRGWRPPVNVVAFVPMRHASERVPGKNYRLLDGRPLFHHMVMALLECPEVVEIAVDTDSPIIAEQCAIHFPSVCVIDRPRHLLGGDMPMTEILRHDAGVIDSEWYLQAHSTSPLLRSETISAGIATLEGSRGLHDSLMSVTRLQTRLYDAEGNPVNHDPQILARTQDLPHCSRRIRVCTYSLANRSGTGVVSETARCSTKSIRLRPPISTRRRILSWPRPSIDSDGRGRCEGLRHLHSTHQRYRRRTGGD